MSQAAQAKLQMVFYVMVSIVVVDDDVREDGTTHDALLQNTR